MYKVKRPFLLTGLILDICAFVLALLVSFFTEGMIYFNYVDYSTYIIILFVILFILGIVLSSISLTVISKDYNNFIKKRKLIIFTIVDVCVVVAVSIFFMFQTYAEPGFYMLLVSVTGETLTIIGYVIAKRNKQTPELLKVKSKIFDDALQKIEKLTKLRDQKIISEEDFNELKRKQLDILEKE